MMHDFKRFPELTSSQMNDFYHESPHRQIFESFEAKCVKVPDGDTIRVLWIGRNFNFPIRFVNTAAPERDEEGGKESKEWLEKQLLGKDVWVHVDPARRIGKYGRLLGKIYLDGIDMGQTSIWEGFSVPWEQRNDGKIPDLSAWEIR